uniref:alpha-mannosidase n=1 Tax=Microbacterium sp. CPCC 204701 TaxID=2493084 RepID=UPI001F0C3B44
MSPQDHRAPIANAPSGTQPRGMASATRPAATPDRTLHMIGNAHLDPVWLWPWQEGYQEARATFASALDRTDEYPDFVFTCDQIVLLSWVEEQDPEMFARIQQRVAEGRWVNVGGWWVEPDCNLPMGESFARQGLYGQRYLQSRFGRISTVGMNVDPFGHSAALPQILRAQRMDSYCFLRPGPHEGDLDETLFQWESADGSRVLAYRIPFEYCSPPGDVSGQTEKSLGQLDRSLGEMMVFYGVGNHGGGPTKANIESIHRSDRMGSFGRMTMSSPRAYFDEMLARGEGFLDGLAVRRDDLQHHAPGCYSSHSGIKAWQRKAQWTVLSAERWAAIDTALTGAQYPRDDLERAWKQILFNQFHDILPGSAIEPSYDDARDQLGEAIAISKRIIARAHNRIARRIDIPMDASTQPVVVFNPHPWPVSVDVDMQYGAQPRGVRIVDHEGAPVVSQATQSTATTGDLSRGAVTFRAEVPALGYALYRMLPGPAAPVETGLRVSDDGTVIENVHVRLAIDPETGDVVSLLDKASGIDPLAGTRGQPRTAVCDDPTDTWGHRVISYAWPGSAMTLDRIVVRETGPLRSRVRVEKSWGSSTLVEEYLLSSDARAVRVDVTIDWRERAHLLKLRFPVGLDDPAATYEIPYGTIQRPVDGAEEPAQSWVDLTGTVGGVPAGLTVVATTKHGWDVSPAGSAGLETASIGITAVRSPVYSWHDPRLLDPDGVYSFQDQGVQRFSLELLPHAGDWRAAQPTRRAAVLGAPVRAQLESFHDGDLPPRDSFADDGAG